ncbi:MAG: hypothetical protein IJV98_05615 [Clostridia bacterium]|nr:hypothetical protein [Clostridia bacterium]
MKRLLFLLLALCLILALMSGCTERMSAAESALIAVKEMDLAALSSCVTPETQAQITRMQRTYEGLDETERATLVRLYAQIRYTIVGTTDTADGGRTVTVTAKLPDMSRVRTLANAQIVFGKTANESVTEILDGGKADVRDVTWEIVLAKHDGEWLVCYDEKINGAWIADLGLTEMLAFFAKH